MAFYNDALDSLTGGFQDYFVEPWKRLLGTEDAVDPFEGMGFDEFGNEVRTQMPDGSPLFGGDFAAQPAPQAPQPAPQAPQRKPGQVTGQPDKFDLTGQRRRKDLAPTGYAAWATDPEGQAGADRKAKAKELERIKGLLNW